LCCTHCCCLLLLLLLPAAAAAAAAHRQKKTSTTHTPNNKDLPDLADDELSRLIEDSATRDIVRAYAKTQKQTTEPEGGEPVKLLSASEILHKATQRAIGGGAMGAAAMFLQVGTLMWLRTSMNYQYAGKAPTFSAALRTLWKEGGVPRFYRGVGPALIQGPMSRFFDVAANAGTLEVLNSNASTRNLPIVVKTACASAAAASARMMLLPVDTLKTTMQVSGTQGPALLMAKIRAGGIRVLWHGAFASSGATFAGHMPWFTVYNSLQEYLPQAESPVGTRARNASIGFSASIVSDTVSNSIRVLKTVRQTSDVVISYPQAFRKVVDADGLMGLFGRGLKTRLLCNGLQGMLFVVLWRSLAAKFFPDQGKKKKDEKK
jgi:hypothetical protein